MSQNGPAWRCSISKRQQWTCGWVYCSWFSLSRSTRDTVPQTSYGSRATIVRERRDTTRFKGHTRYSRTKLHTVGRITLATAVTTNSPQATGTPHCVGLARPRLSIGQDSCVKSLEEGFVKRSNRTKGGTNVLSGAQSHSDGKMGGGFEWVFTQVDLGGGGRFWV